MMNEQEKKIPELLAPAGDLETALVAFQCGADAVYAGLSKFNARERTQNFTESEFASLITYARMHRKKVYLALNTLVMDREIPEVIDFLGMMAALRPDAVIVQDLGILRLIRDYFPELPLHASTQMAVHNSAGVNFLAEKGIQRVILERQVTLEELKIIKRRTTLELEIFIHGALCCSLSGVCLFSSWIGGWSGNRGKCKQPCRRRYFSQEGNGFFFSTKDLYTLDMIPSIKKLGIASLKIEGRLRKADYVGPVVKAYRLMLDAPAEKEQSALKEAKSILNRTTGRQWSHGFLTKKATETVIHYTSLGSQGQWVGDVKEVKENGFILHASQRLFVGDKIRVQPKSGEEGPSFIITLMRENNQPVHKSSKNATLFIHCDKKIPEKGTVFRLGTSRKQSNVMGEKIPDIWYWVRLQVRLSYDGLYVTLQDPPLPEVFHIPGDIQPAQKYVLTQETLEGELIKLRADGIGLLGCTLFIEDAYFVQNKELRRMRQALATQLKDCLKAYVEKKKKEASHDTITLSNPPSQSPIVSIYYPPELSKTSKVWRIRDLDDPHPAEERMLPLFCPETQLEPLKKRLYDAINSGMQTFRISSLYGFGLLQPFPHCHIHSSFSIPASNSLACQELVDWGAEKVLLWPELDREGMESILKKAGNFAEVLVDGKVPILVTRAKIPIEGKIQDQRGAIFYVKRRGDLTFLFPEKKLSLPIYPSCHHLQSDTHDENQSVTDWNLRKNGNRAQSLIISRQDYIF